MKVYSLRQLNGGLTTQRPTSSLLWILGHISGVLVAAKWIREYV